MSAPDRHVPDALTTTLTIASLTLKRLSRGRALWVSFLIALMPLIYAMMIRGEEMVRGDDELFAIEILILSVLAPMFVGASIGEEIETRTTTYLWSRPVPRWSVLAGKLLALVPLTAAILIASWTSAAQIAWQTMPPIETHLALLVGTTAISLVAMGIATLGPRHGMALTICYMLFFDFPIGVLPATLQEASVSHHIRTLAGLWRDHGTTTDAAIGLSIICALWTFAAAIRIRRMEA